MTTNGEPWVGDGRQGVVNTTAENGAQLENGKGGNKQTQRKHKEHVVKLLNRGKLSGQYSQRLFRKLPPRVCVPLKNIVSEEFLRAGHIFLGSLSVVVTCCPTPVTVEDDDFSSIHLSPLLGGSSTYTADSNR
nr:DDB1- and CUL4-associated factor 15 [Salvelinus alpinus]